MTVAGVEGGAFPGDGRPRHDRQQGGRLRSFASELREAEQIVRDNWDRNAASLAPETRAMFMSEITIGTSIVAAYQIAGIADLETAIAIMRRQIQTASYLSFGDEFVERGE